MKPYLKWAGGKRQLLPVIMNHIPENIDDYTYIEPFIGAGAVLLHLGPKKAIINDFNNQLVTTYRVIRDDVENLIQNLLIHKELNSSEYYYQVRELDRTDDFMDLTDTEKAARLIYLNKTGFNGLYRVNSQGFYNVPYGIYKNPAILEESTLREISEYLNSNDIEIYSGDFNQLREKAGPKTFYYCDPPYASFENATNFTGYQAGGFGNEDQIRLRDLALHVDSVGGKILLSNSDTPFIREIYKDFIIETVLAKRNINSKGSGRGPVNEVLIRNY